MIDYYNDIFPIFQGMMCMMLVYIGLQNYFIPDKAYRFYFFQQPVLVLAFFEGNISECFKGLNTDQR